MTDADDTDTDELSVGTHDERWQYSLDDVEEPEPETVDPGSPETEHVLFVLLGVAVTLGAFVHLIL